MSCIAKERSPKSRSTFDEVLVRPVGAVEEVVALDTLQFVRDHYGAAEFGRLTVASVWP